MTQRGVREYEPSAMALAAQRACVTFRRLANTAAREGNATEEAKHLALLRWHKQRARMWKALADA